MDIIGVEDQHGRIFCTEFYIKFRTALIDQAAIALLGDDDIDLTQLIHRAFPDEIPSIATNNTSDGNTVTKLDIEWVDVYVNSILNKDIIAFVGNGQLVHFFDMTTRKYSIHPSTKILPLFQLQSGKNTIHVHHRKSDSGISFNFWLYSPHDKFVIMDIDGTITKSDVTGYMQTVFMGIYTHIHDGIVDLMNYFTEKYNYRIVYLTARPNGHRKSTSDFLLGMTQSSTLKLEGMTGSNRMPDGPLLMNKDRVMKVLFREMVLKDTMLAKMDSLSQIMRAFKKAGSTDLSPFVLGIGNKNHDALAYNSAGIPKDRILIINTSSEMVVWKYAVAGAIGTGEVDVVESSEADGSKSSNTRGGLLGRWRSNNNINNTQASTNNTEENTTNIKEDMPQDAPSTTMSSSLAIQDPETDVLIQQAANYDSTECYTGPTTFQTYQDPKLIEYIDYLAAHRVY